LVNTWLNLLPITHDTEEAQFQYEILAEMVMTEQQVIFGANTQNAMNQVVKVFAESFQDKYFTEKNKLMIAQCVRFLATQATEPFMNACN